MSRRAGFAGSARERWSCDPSRVESDSEEGEEATTDESPDAYRWGPYPFSTYSLDNEFPAATRQLARNECAREFRRYYEGLQAPNTHLGFSLMSFVFMLRLLKPVLFPGYDVPFEEGWEYISDGCRVTHVLENAVPWVLTVFLLRFGFQSHSGTGRLLRPPHVIWYHVIMILLTMGSCAVRPPTPEHRPPQNCSREKSRVWRFETLPPELTLSLLRLSQRHTLQCPIPGGMKVELAMRLFVVIGICVAWRPNVPWMAASRFSCWATYVHLVRENRPGVLAWWPLVIADFCLIVGLPVLAAWKLEQKARRMFFDECAMTSVWSNGGGFRGRRAARSSGSRSRSSSHGAATPRRMPSPPPLPERRSWWKEMIGVRAAQG